MSERPPKKKRPADPGREASSEAKPRRAKRRESDSEGRPARRSAGRDPLEDDASESGSDERPRKRRRERSSPDPEDSTSELTSDVDSTSEGGDAAAPSASLAELRADLTSRSARKREAAAHGLGKLGSKARPAVPALARLLEDEEERVQLRAARAIGKIGPAAASAVPALVKALGGAKGSSKSDETSLPSVAVRALKRIGAEAWPGLLAGFQDPAQRKRIARLLAAIEPQADAPTLAAVETLLEPGLEEAAELVLSVLKRHGAAAVPLILPFAGADDAPELQDLAEETLEGLGKEAAPALASALVNPDPGLRLAAAKCLTRIAQEVSQRAVAKVCARLEAALGDADLTVRLQVVDALGALSEYATRAEPALIQALGDTESRVSLAAVMALLDISSDKNKLAERMVEVLEEERGEFIRVGACMVLMHLGPVAKHCVPALLKAVEDPATEVREYAHLALQAIRTPSMRVSVIRTASLRLKVVDEDDEDDDDDDRDDESTSEDKSGEEQGPRVPKKRRRGGLRPRKVRRRK